MGLYGWEAILPWECNFWMGRLAYNISMETYTKSIELQTLRVILASAYILYCLSAI